MAGSEVGSNGVLREVTEYRGTGVTGWVARFPTPLLPYSATPLRFLQLSHRLGNPRRGRRAIVPILAAVAEENIGGKGKCREGADRQESPANGAALLGIQMIGQQERGARAQGDASAGDQSKFRQGYRSRSHGDSFSAPSFGEPFCSTFAVFEGRFS